MSLPAAAERLRGSAVLICFQEEIGRAAADLLLRCGAHPILDAEPPLADAPLWWRKIAGKYGRLDAVFFNPPLLHERASLPRLLSVLAEAPVYLRRAANPHLIVLCPSLQALPEGASPAAAGAAFALSAAAFAACGALYGAGIAVNGLWPRALPDTASIRAAYPSVLRSGLRRPELTAAAVVALLSKPAPVCAGNFLLDDLTLEAEGLPLQPHLPEGPSYRMPFVAEDAAETDPPLPVRRPE